MPEVMEGVIIPAVIIVGLLNELTEGVGINHIGIHDLSVLKHRPNMLVEQLVVLNREVVCSAVS